MKNIYLLIPLAVSLVCGCKSTNEPTSNNKPSSNSEKYFPLKLGNKWYYNTANYIPDSIDLIWEVTGQEVLNDILYYRIIKQYLRYNTTDTQFYRFNGDTLFCKSKNIESIIADFSLNLNETASWFSDLKVVRKTDSLIEFSTPFGIDYGYSITFLKGYGITKIISNGIVYYETTLIKAEIK